MSLPVIQATTLSELEQLKQRNEETKSDLYLKMNEKTTTIDQNYTKLQNIMTQLTELTNKIYEMEFYLAEVQGEVDQRKSEIVELNDRIKTLETKMAQRLELLTVRVRAIQLNGGAVDYVDVIVGAHSFSDFIDRFSAVNTLLAADRVILLQQAEDSSRLAEQKNTIETMLKEQQKRQEALKQLNDSIVTQKAKQDELVKHLETEQQRLAEEQKELTTQFEKELELSIQLENEIIEEQQRLAEIAKKEQQDRRQKASEQQLASTPLTYSAKMLDSPFIKPATGRHTSGFGKRDIGAGAETHLGYDIANATGTSVVAAADGYVSFAGTMGGYGNVVIVTHVLNGQTHATVYAHLNSLSVTKNQFVLQGQSLGGMGNTGRSTGTHVHFEVHIGQWNGARSNAVDPSRYID